MYALILTAIGRAYTTTTSVVTTSTSPATAPPASPPSSAGASFLTHLPRICLQARSTFIGANYSLDTNVTSKRE